MARGPVVTAGELGRTRTRLVVRHGLAYGSSGSARVSPDPTLVFEVRLIDVR